MKAVVFHGIGDIRLDDVPEPKIEKSTDAIVRITSSAICGSDLHLVRGTIPGMEPGTIIGHEAVGIVQEVGSDVRDLKIGDRVGIPATIACGYCSYCRDGYFSQCDNANPNGPRAGSAWFGGPKSSGPFQGLQAEYARVPFANVGLVKIPDEINDDQAILATDIFTTGYFGAKLAEIKPGNTVAVFGCGPVGLFTIMSCIQFMQAGRVFAVDRIPDRLEMAKSLGAEVINFDKEDPVKTIMKLTDEIGVDRAIDAVGVDAEPPQEGWQALKHLVSKGSQHKEERQKVAPEQHPEDENWHAGHAPSQALDWTVNCLAKAGTLSIIGVYPETANFFPLGLAMHHNLTVNMGVCNHRKYIPHILELIRSGAAHPEKIISQVVPMTEVLDAYHNFDSRHPGWVKVELIPGRQLVGMRGM